MKRNKYEDEVIKAAQNLIKVKGRFHTELAYKHLQDAVEKLKEYHLNEDI